MLKEKINGLFKSEGNNKKKIENLVFLLVILIVTVLAINYIWSGDKGSKVAKTEASANEQKDILREQEQATSNNLEESLKRILTQIDGVGTVDVLLTYSESTEIVPVYNKSEKVTNTTEGDSGGGKRTIQESDVSQEVVYEDKDGNGSIAIKKEVTPKIEGAIITASGANNASVKTSIVQAVEAATGLATHKIQVFEKKK